MLNLPSVIQGGHITQIWEMALKKGMEYVTVVNKLT